MAFSVSGIGRAAAAEAGFRCISVVDMIYIILFGQHPKKKSESRTGSSLTGMLPLFFLGLGQTMPAELRKAHQENDRAVMQAYGFPVKSTFTESQCVAELFKRYQELVIGD